MAGAMCSLLVVYACWQMFRWTPAHRALAGDVFFYPFVAAAAWAAWRASRRCARASRLRSAWCLVTLAMLASFGGEIAQTVHEALHHRPFPSVADAFFLTFYPLMLLGVLRFAVGSRTVGERVRLSLDLAVVAIGTSAVVLYLVLGPTVVAGSPDLLQGVFSVAYPVGDVVLLVGLASVLVREADATARRSLWFMAAGLLLYVTGDVIYGYISLNSSYHGGDPVDSFWVLAIAMWAMAGAAQPRPEERSAQIAQTRRTRASWAPHLATAAGFAVLIFMQRRDPFFPNVSVALTACLIASLVSARQFLAQSDLMRMQRRSSYESLHDVLTGLPNRRCLLDDLGALLASAGPHSQWTLAMFDLDGFKLYNDTFGHLAGDQLLTRLGRRLGAAVKSHGRAYRLGGDEFCVLLNGVAGSSEALLTLASEAMSEQGAGFRIGSSFGTVSIPEEADDVSGALHIADTRMYAKKSGRRAASLIAQTRDVLLSATAEHAHDLGDHMLEVGELSRNVARRLELDAETIDLTLRTGELHDVGKVAVPESVLHKAGPLTDEEWTFIRNHTMTGERILSAAPALRGVAKLVRSTHERFDGSGYPDGLKGDEIPLPARIVCACDAFHAIVSDRPYAPGITVAQAREELLRCAGTHFDPRVVQALLAELADDATDSAMHPAYSPLRR